MPKEKKKEVLKKVGLNILIAAIIAIYFAFVIMGFKNIERTVYIKDLKVFSLVIIAFAVILFEQAYNKDSGKIAIFGIETLVIAITTLISLYIAILYDSKFIIYNGIVCGVAVIYYIIKSIAIFIRERRNWKNGISDVKDIVNDEE